MRRFSFIAAVVTLLAAAPASLPPTAGVWDVHIMQSGVATEAVRAGSVFEVRGSGFHARVLPVKVCLSGVQCQLAEVDPSGQFVVARSIGAPGSYTVTVHQAKGMQLTEWRLKAWKDITVTN